ncbi:CPBP family intramembrane glutamic endopeptidase [Aurantiacibacter hainanensis]|uniref:CPBP family intramembrane glutamic endopeptidase n=1 Tax=Aurantiacibacter hainanensis TaxID=3076114 RepID=UPI0030C70E14
MRQVHWLLLIVLLWTGAIWYFVALSARGLIGIEVPSAAIMLGAIGMVAITGIFVFKEGRWQAVGSWLALTFAARKNFSAYLAALIPAGLFAVGIGLLPILGAKAAFDPVLSVGVLGLLIPVWIEEIVWRGYALPRLLEVHTPIQTGLILSIVWVLWHIPFYLMPGYNTWGMVGWLAWVPFYVVYTFYLTWLGVKTQFSVLLAMISHLAVNWFVSSTSPPFVENYVALLGALILAPLTIHFMRLLKAKNAYVSA